MSKIMLRGFGLEPEGIAEARKLRDEVINPIIRELKLGKEGITEIVPSEAQICDGTGKSAPYIVVTTAKEEDSDEGTMIVDALLAANFGVHRIDVERQLIEDFYPAAVLRRRHPM